MSDSDKPIDENQVIAKFKELQSECKTFATKISELQEELGEHRWVTLLLLMLLLFIACAVLCHIVKRSDYRFIMNCTSSNVCVLEFYSLNCRLVEQTLQPLDAKRRAFRLVGGVLVERTVGEVLPSVTINRENVSERNKKIVQPLGFLRNIILYH